MMLPVRTIVQPSCLNGQSNGRLDPAILHDTPAPGVAWPCRLIEPAARAWRALTAAAQVAGHTLKPSGPFDSYRPYDVQERIFRQRFTTTPNGSSTRRTWNGQTWYLRPGCALAAVPGTSNHGRAIAVDVGEETDGDTGTESISRPTLDWLLANEERFGFSHEVQSEPWHIRYFAGDWPPQAVIDHERTSQPAPATPPTLKDHTMSIVNIKGSQYNFLHLGGRDFVAISGPRVLELVAAGVPRYEVSNDAFQGGAESMLHGAKYG